MILYSSFLNKMKLMNREFINQKIGVYFVYRSDQFINFTESFAVFELFKNRQFEIFY